MSFKFKNIGFCFFIFGLFHFSFAFGGLDKANTLLNNVNTALYGLAAITVTIAFLIVGYKILFGGQTIRECIPIIIGAIIIASASSLGAFFIS
ncbi:TrbC/VirB2 family protein [Helicobacter trogontum]|uniref:Conjugal transfer protein TraC n=1 Tax=Helicobacter trogontum TaxID=50960 RepID=A0A4U8S053_9HELI|nr:TrbC/VirB2 family protein [Helicobacter trogontum]TLD79014.1 hypothetical protein LS81_010945 [Helicobacter trogontum]